MSKTWNMSCIPQLYVGNKVVQVYCDLVAVSGYHLSNSQPFYDCYQPKPLLYKLILMSKTYNMSCIPQLYGGNKVVHVYSELVAVHSSNIQPYVDCYQPKPLLYKLILMYKT